MILSYQEVCRLADGKARTHVSTIDLRDTKLTQDTFEFETAKNLLMSAGYEGEKMYDLAIKEDFHFTFDKGVASDIIIEATWLPVTKEIRIFLPFDEVKRITWRGAPFHPIFLANVNLDVRGVSPRDQAGNRKTLYACAGWNVKDRVWEYEPSKKN